MPKNQSTISSMSRASTSAVTTAHSEQSLGPNLKSRLEALEAAMGVRLNVAKRQGRQSLSNTTSSSPMQISPTSASSTTISTNTNTTTSLSTSTRHNIPTRTGQGIQRSASSCDTENRPGPIKRLKPSLPIETSSSSTATAIATIKKYTPPIRRPITTLIAPIRPVQSKSSPLIKQRSSPMDTSSSSLRSSRSSTINSNNTNYHTLIGLSTKTPHTSSTKQIIITSSSSSSPPPPPARPATYPRKHRLPIFGEQFSDDILKTNLLWINLNELDDEGQTEVVIQFGSIDNFLREQQSFSAKQQQLKLVARNKTIVNRTRLQLLLPKKDRLELL
ncbi:unnamed protein product [Adineta steineri]|uniref:Uncharacterized protein n=1 Tax=Adineta steineri TaxID=433720 RepID=A0A813PSU3_9BILA|nr:unnamed protein product [Adineta steineri]CAF0784200.1 unnamed protein product [Adineta steineri]CAF0786253.1 unnamed protein product [Adineta steineri]CAF3504119.1 unnamed protein product [Adineta steineri]CAF3686683.1 unnamed protein product [Adineta steineri]